MITIISCWKCYLGRSLCDGEWKVPGRWGLNFTVGHPWVGMKGIWGPRSQGLWVCPLAHPPKTRSSRKTLHSG